MSNTLGLDFPSWCLGALLTLPLIALGQTNVVTQHNDIARTGQNLTETTLTPAVVSSGGFGKLYSVNVDGRVFGQPLYVSNVAVNGAGHSVVYVATSHDSVYALEAAANGAVLWQASLLDAAHGAAAGAIPDPQSDTGCGDVDNSEYGVMGTPVIDPVAGTLYVVSLTYEGSYPIQRLHALDIATGAEKPGSPVVIAASVAGTGSGSSNGVIAFDPKWENQRAGLLLVNGTVYIGWGSHCDSGPWHGWIIGYNATSLARTFTFMASPNGAAAGVWQSGMGLAADNGGGTSGTATPRLFAATGNGNFDSNGDWGESVLNLNLASGATTLVTDSFTPSNQAQLTAADEDLGSAGPILLPNAVGTAQHPHLALELSKAGVMYLLDRDKLGGFNSTDRVLQEVTFGAYEFGIWGGPAYFNNNIYFWSADGNMQQYSLANGVLSNAPTAVNAITSPGTGGGYYSGTFLGATPSISANGGSNGIVWVDDTVRDQGGPIQYLYAFDAQNVANTLWSSQQNPSRDGAGGSQKFAVPTIADGRVFLAGQNQLNVYGVLPPGFALTTNDSAFTVIPGSSTTTTVAVNPYGGFSGSVNFSVSGLPAGVTASFSPAASTTSSRMTLTAASTAATSTGADAITILGTSGNLTQSLPVQVSVADSVQPVPANLSGEYSTYGTVNLGNVAPFGGLDSSGYAYAANLLGSSLSAMGMTFNFGPAGGPNSLSSEYVALPSGQYSTVYLLGTAVNGAQTSQTFVVTYADGSTTTFTQSLSDWGAPQHFAGETVASAMPYRVTPSGTADNSESWNLYGYSFPIDPSKTMRGLTLPANADVVILAITLGAATPAQGAVNLSAVANVYSSFESGVAPTAGGLDSEGYAYAANVLGTSLSADGSLFQLGAAGAANAVSSLTVPLPNGSFTALNLLGAGVNGNQVNQTFVVTYSDGTTTAFPQSLSDWCTSQGYSGETVALSMPYRLAPGGSQTGCGAASIDVYAYSFALNAAKSVSSVTLPNNRDVVLLAATLVPATTVPAATFTLSPSSGTLSLAQNSGGQLTVAVNPLNGFTGTVTLAVTGLPAGASGAFSGNALTVFPSLSTATGTYPLTITGTSGAARVSTTISLVITPGATFTLIPAASSVNVAAGAAGTDAISIAGVNGFASSVSFSVAGLPPGVSAAFSPPSSASAATLELAVAGTAAAGTYPLTITGSVAATGTSSAFTAATTVALVVTAATSTQQSINFAPIPAQTAGKSLTLGATATSGLTVTYTSSTPSVCTVSGTVASFVAAGTCSITAAQGGNGTYAAATPVTQSFSVAAAAPFTISGSTLTLQQNGGGTEAIVITNSPGFTGNVSLAFAGAPPYFTPALVGTTLIVFPPFSTPVGTYPLTITGTSGQYTVSTVVNVTITAGANFSLTPATASLDVAAGATGTDAIAISGVNGFSSAVAFLVTGLPAGVTATFTAPSSNVGTTLGLVVAGTAVAGSYALTVTGSVSGTGNSNPFSQTTQITLVVAPPVKAPSISLTPKPASVTVIPPTCVFAFCSGGVSATDAITLTPANGFAGAVSFSVSGLPTGVTASFSPTSVTTSGATTLTLTPSSTAATGRSAPITIKGTSGSVSATTLITLKY